MPILLAKHCGRRNGVEIFYGIMGLFVPKVLQLLLSAGCNTMLTQNTFCAKYAQNGLNLGKNTKYFLNLEKSPRGNKSINKIKNTKGILVTEQQAILEVLTQYFKSFYTSTDNNVDSIQLRNYLSNIDLPVLSKDQTENISVPISEKECHDALNAMCTNKSPGPDGFTAEFYKTFWDDLKPFFLECVRFS